MTQWSAFILTLGLTVACSRPAPSSLRQTFSVPAPTITVATQPLNRATTCTNRFIAHPLDHVTTVADERVRLFDSNGSGLAINDLDNDGDLDLVLANLAGVNAIFWNEGQLKFRKEPLPYGNSRAVAIVDVDGDGWQDIVFTRTVLPPVHWRNQLGERLDSATPAFVEMHLPGVAKQAYTMSWGDPDKDGDLDLVTGSYDLALEMAQGDAFRNGSGAGLHYYEQRDGRFIRHFLDLHAQTLALFFFDANGDGWQDIVAGNDFDLPDYTWLYTPTGWQLATPFAHTTQNTMSFDSGDINNDGQPELFASDMKPYAIDVATLAAWLPVMQTMEKSHPANRQQIVENVLQVRNASGKFVNQAIDWGVTAAGWGWSSKFGDLDNDGYLDLYVVNGMTALDLFDYLPNNELIEENQAFRNRAGREFVSATEWGLNASEGGRGMSMADLDLDGDLDIVINNLLASSVVFENRLCGGAGLEIDLRWPGSQNSYALGAQLTLSTNQGLYYRDVRANSGYLSGDPARVHFGLPAGSHIDSLTIRWPDGAITQLETLSPATLTTITRHDLRSGG